MFTSQGTGRIDHCMAFVPYLVVIYTFLPKCFIFQIQEDEDEEEEFLLTYNCTTRLQKMKKNEVNDINLSNTNKTTKNNNLVIEWSLLPKHVICAFPYILSLTSDAIEFRSVVNGSFLHTLAMPELQIISAKVISVNTAVHTTDFHMSYE